jgi:hypothetical protein
MSICVGFSVMASKNRSCILTLPLSSISIDRSTVRASHVPSIDLINMCLAAIAGGW